MIYLLAPRDSEDAPTAQAWDGDAQQAFSDLVGRVPALVDGARTWLAGELSAEDFRKEVDATVTAFSRSRERLAGLETPPEFAVAHDLYNRSAQLYVECVRTYDVALDLAPGEPRAQLDLLARRLRELGDRVFDRGRTELGLDRPPEPNVDVNTPEEVPIWTAEGLATGPPLDEPPPPPADTPPLRAETRPQQSRAAWDRAVRAADIPAAAELRGAVKRGDPARLAAVARRFVAAAEELREKPDPRGGRELSARFRLGLLVAADAARAAQAGALLQIDVLGGMADRLVGISTALRRL